MGGGKEAGFLEAKPILQQMGKNVIHTGQVGTGQVSEYLGQDNVYIILYKIILLYSGCKYWYFCCYSR